METPIYTEKTRQFILDTLLPYKVNPELCAMQDNLCLYLTTDGRKCAVGKHMKKGEWQQFHGGFENLISSYPKEIFLTKKALSHNLTNEIWCTIQDYHDNLADFKYVYGVGELERLTQLKFPELRKDYQI